MLTKESPIILKRSTTMVLYIFTYFSYVLGMYVLYLNNILPTIVHGSRLKACFSRSTLTAGELLQVTYSFVFVCVSCVRENCARDLHGDRTHNYIPRPPLQCLLRKKKFYLDFCIGTCWCEQSRMRSCINPYLSELCHL